MIKYFSNIFASLGSHFKRLKFFERPFLNRRCSSSAMRWIPARLGESKESENRLVVAGQHWLLALGTDY